VGAYTHKEAMTLQREYTGDEPGDLALPWSRVDLRPLGRLRF